MSTLSELSESGALVEIDPLEDHELPFRRLFGTPEFISWLENSLPTFQHNPVYSALTPLEQVFALLADYSAGEKMNDDRRFKKLIWNPEYHVWEFKTEDVRVFGWVPEFDTFICCFGGLADEIKLKHLYGQFILKTKFVRDSLLLDEPKAVLGGRYPDVISNKA